MKILIKKSTYEVSVKNAFYYFSASKYDCDAHWLIIN
jgi:hypothetical protein